MMRSLGPGCLLLLSALHWDSRHSSERGDSKGEVSGAPVFRGIGEVCTVGQGLYLSQCTHGSLVAE